MLNGQITHSYVGNTCSVVIPHPHVKEKPKPTPSSTPTQSPASEQAATEASAEGVPNLERIRNVDIFIGDNDLYFFADIKLYKFHSRRNFDLRGLKTVHIKYDTKDNFYQLHIRCLPPVTGVVASGGATGNPAANTGVAVAPKPKTARKEYIAAFLNLPRLADTLQDKEPVVHEWKLKRITDLCQLQLDASESIYKPSSHFGFGFASRYSGSLQSSELDISTCRVPDPQRLSPLQRRMERVADEMKRFSREQYKMNFVELQVPAGHQNPLRYKPKVHMASMTQQQAQLLFNLCRPRDNVDINNEMLSSYCSNAFSRNEIDCGLISIILAICYDVRTTNNEPTCESGWTRSILCPLYCYFEQFDNYRDVLVAFLRRVITYPLYRNFELGRQCVRDAIEMLKGGGGRSWLLNQLLLTRQQFDCGEPSRVSFNNYYLDDYLRYLSSAQHCSDEHLHLLARNLKNVLMDVSKRHLDMGIIEIETELIKELMQEMRIDAGSGSGSGSESPAPNLHQVLPHQEPRYSDQVDDDVDSSSGQDDETTTDDDSVITDSFDSMDLRLIENDVYGVDEENDDEDEDDGNVDDDDEDDDPSEVDEHEHPDEDSNSSTTTTSEAEGNSVIEQCTSSNSEAAASSSTK